MIAFEYPLNEKIRSYLRFESLFLQIKKSKDLTTENDSIAFFKALFELLELSERCDIRHDLVKDLRQLSEQMNSWLALPEVDYQAVSKLIIEINELIDAVLNMPKQLRYFKTNRFLTSLKQRFSIPSGCCNFDLPQFHFWLASDLEKRQQDSQRWFSYFVSLDLALALFLKIKRSQGVSSELKASNGVYQGEVENCSFLIIKLEQKQAVYPMISGHKNRYSIRFVDAEVDNQLSENIVFEQICC
ncbi:cell division protein ZapD [Psychromonas antarctica]|jgi:cell division protein ZapD|uniref:cell division protein ZapD n=1 Tax=Psychromonas antarctica TaxID=67573 RepID=UPI001EE7AD90|nr:cell division protein ZapD [Psychromonas antarctica]MCG6200903.1 cell division protein ZapD [Psychromonas antarctica]